MNQSFFTSFCLNRFVNPNLFIKPRGIIPLAAIGCFSIEEGLGSGLNLDKGTVTGTPWKFESVDISKVWVLGDMDKISDVVQC